MADVFFAEALCLSFGHCPFDFSVNIGTRKPHNEGDVYLSCQVDIKVSTLPPAQAVWKAEGNSISKWIFEILRFPRKLKTYQSDIFLIYKKIIHVKIFICTDFDASKLHLILVFCSDFSRTYDF